MREIILDTESTGLDPDKGHRLVEIGCVEFLNRVPTGKVFHTYLNPERDVPEEAYRIHKLSTEFLKDKPLFSEVHQDFLLFLGEDPLVIHNASFDLKFINAELKRVNLPLIPLSRATDTVLLARRKFPGSPANLDALCSRFKINISQRAAEGHGALLDAQLLAKVYIELLGGNQIELSIGREKEITKEGSVLKNERLSVTPPRPHAPTSGEIEAHRVLCKGLKNPLWNLFKS
ncbi:MAG: DNA polymerase III subunit epsilon [Alphaproteobacteria bacterium 16-39-46]|nr:MAG: DNA polymerase III subunit epsilon [Alphaproteobacteria bacterium 16-39-46]OZA43466.1 MAG: DNA polymerase III subunit epsilon [Alphaproteobacteria bacterium 17-39-52]HQS84459.1 DNA polymerase III subunit epsilon [Alphaproteobacteria bacterium]HQS94241.1 DNA polymerase III subunit epsilon [Alphaproteobacteria bacterium]